MKEGLTPSKIDQLLAKIKPRPVVALVDGDPVTLDLLERTFHDEGYETHRFERGEDLLAQFLLIRPDAVVMEAVLPEMNGLSVLDELRPKRPEEMVPVMILSEKSDLRAKLLAFRRGACDYLTKPFEGEELAARVRALIRSKILQEMLQTSSIADPLTSLYNQRFLVSWLDRELERVKRYGLELSCLWIDLDRFHDLNETQGEPFGDFLLREFAGLVSRHTRASDVVGRIQNDEFLVLLPGTNKEKATLVAHRLRQLAGGRRFEFEEEKASPSFCIGITGCRSEEVPDPSSFLRKAEEALEKAKQIGAGETAVLEMN